MRRVGAIRRIGDLMDTVLKTVSPRGRRVLRSPIFPLAGTVVPFGLYPMMAHPLMAGEVVNSWNVRGTMISQPLVNPLSGGWLEAWLVEVPLAGITARDYKPIVLNVSPSTTGFLAAAANPLYFQNVGSLKLVEDAYNEAVAQFFTAPGTTVPQVLDSTIYSMPVVGSDWAQNLQVIPATGDPTKWPEASVDTELTGIDLETERTLVEADAYDQWVQEYGVKDPKKEHTGVRIRRYFRQWVNPSNVIDPTSGVPRSAHVFSFRFGLRKGFKVQEPAVLLALWCYRPQTYRKSFLASYCGRMIGLKQWVPPRGSAAWSMINGDDPLFPAGFDTGGPAANYAFDRSDIWAMGETLINRADASNPYPPPGTGAGITNANTAAMRSRYPTLAEVKALFATSTTVKDYCAYYGALAGLRASGQTFEVAPT